MLQFKTEKDCENCENCENGVVDLPRRPCQAPCPRGQTFRRSWERKRVYRLSEIILRCVEQQKSYRIDTHFFSLVGTKWFDVVGYP